MAEKTYEFPDDCHFTRTDEWIRMDGAVGHVGITDYAQSELSDIVFVELPDVGRRLEAGEPFGVVESVKAVSDLVAPVSCEIVEAHPALGEHPEWVNEDPYGRGWLVAIAPDDLDDLDSLLSPEQYAAFVEERAKR
ncbi:MAG: glycine cleavage system protein GcvH [Myxococcota bacterium]